MAVTFDNMGSSTGNLAASSGQITGYVVGAGSNRAIIVQVGFDGQGATGVSVHLDPGGANLDFGAALIDHSSGGAAGRTLLFGLVNPPTGTWDILCSWTGTFDQGMGAASFFGVDQTGGATSFPNATFNTGNSTTCSVPVTSAVGNYTVGCGANAGAALSDPTQTSIWIDLSWSGGSGAGSYGAGAATVTHQWTVGSTQQWVAVGVDVKAAGGAPASDGLMWL